MIRNISSNKKYNIAVDVDGVLANQINGILPDIQREFGINLCYADITDCRLSISNTSIKKIIVSKQKERSYIVSMPLHSNARRVIDKLRKRHYIAIATARSKETESWTKEWLNKHEIYFDRYYNLREGDKQKADEDFDILIDDHVENVKSFVEKHSRKAILFSQPWNQNREDVQKFIQEGRLLIVKKWGEVLNIVNNL